MKKLCSTFVALILILSCLTSVYAEDDVETISSAISALQDYWASEMYDEFSMSERGYWEIKNTRVIYIKDNPTATGNSTTDKYATEMFGNMRCIIEFVLFTDYLGSAPYYPHIGIAESVAVKKDGTMEVVEKTSLLDQYRVRTYNTNYNNIIESVLDYGAEFNTVQYLLDK